MTGIFGDGGSGGADLMNPMASLQEMEALFSEDRDAVAEIRMRMMDDPRFALEVATHEAAHAFWGYRLGMPIKNVSLHPPETDFDLTNAVPERSAYLRRLKHRISTSMESWLGKVPDLEHLLDMNDDTFFAWLDACKPDYPDDMYEKTTRYKTVCASPKTIPVRFPDVHTMQRIVWTDGNPLHRPPTKLDLAIMLAMIPVMGPFYGKTWSNLYGVDPDAEITSFTDWLCMDKPTDLHYLHNYLDNGKNRFFWHTSLKMAENCGGHNDYWDILFSGLIVPEPATDESNLQVIERLSGMSTQDVVLATFLSPFNILHPNRAQIMFAIDGLAQALLNGSGIIGGLEATRILEYHARLYTEMKNLPKTAHTPTFRAAERWGILYEQHINRHLSTILNNQFKDGSKRFFKAVDYFNDPKWTPIVAEATYNKFKHENWFTWTDQPFKQGRLTAAPTVTGPKAPPFL